MMTVRFPNGQAVTYNDAHFIEHSPVTWRLMDKEGGRCLAIIQASAGVIVDLVRPCKVENSAQVQTLESAARMVVGNLRDIPGSIAANLKLQLESFNRQTRRWKK